VLLDLKEKDKETEELDEINVSLSSAKKASG
jgi:hypothetical protein